MGRRSPGQLTDSQRHRGAFQVSSAISSLSPRPRRLHRLQVCFLATCLTCLDAFHGEGGSMEGGDGRASVDDHAPVLR